MNKNNAINILLILFCLYYLQGTLYSQGIIGKLLIAIILSICFYYYIKVNVVMKNCGTYVKMLSILILLNIIGTLIRLFEINPIITTNGYEISSINTLKIIMIGLLPFYPIYYFSRKGVNLSKTFKLFFFAFFIISIINYFLNIKNVEILRQEETNIVNNFGYSFVMLFPFIFLFKFKNKFITPILIVIIESFILYSAKRGAIICGAIELIIFTIYSIKNGGNKIKKIILSTVFLLIISFVAYQIFESNDLLQQRLEATLEGQSSGRDRLYNDSWNHWLNSTNAKDFFIGGGINNSVKVLGLFAHNDWFELLLSYGLLGIVIYIPIVFIPIKNYWNKTLSLQDRYISISVGIIWLFTSIFSMAYFNDQSFLFMILLGYILGKNKN